MFWVSLIAGADAGDIAIDIQEVALQRWWSNWYFASLFQRFEPRNVYDVASRSILAICWHVKKYFVQKSICVFIRNGPHRMEFMYQWTCGARRIDATRESIFRKLARRIYSTPPFFF